MSVVACSLYTEFLPAFIETSSVKILNEDSVMKIIIKLNYQKQLSDGILAWLHTLCSHASVLIYFFIYNSISSSLYIPLTVYLHAMYLCLIAYVTCRLDKTV